MKKDNLGSRMKEYEMQTRTRLLRKTPVIIRLDGKSFHTLTKGLNKPFDEEFLKIMQFTMLKLCENIQNCVLGYTQSDEITLVLIDYKERNTSAWFDNQVQKMVSVSSSLATLYFNEGIYNILKNNNKDICKSWENKIWKGVFDSRIFNLPNHEVENNLIWRQQDATRNSINSLAQSLFSQKELNGINSKKVQDKMLIEKNVNWNNISTTFKRGSCCIKNNENKWEIDNDIPIFIENREYIRNLIYIGQFENYKENK